MKYMEKATGRLTSLLKGWVDKRWSKHPWINTIKLFTVSTSLKKFYLISLIFFATGFIEAYLKIILLWRLINPYFVLRPETDSINQCFYLYDQIEHLPKLYWKLFFYM